MAYLREYPRGNPCSKQYFWKVSVKADVWILQWTPWSDFISAHRKFHSWDLFAEVWEVRWRGTFYPVADLGEGPGAPGPPVIFIPNWDPKGRKDFFEDRVSPLSQGLDDPPPRPLSEYLDPPLLSLSKPKTTTYGLNSFSYFSAKQ